MKKNVKTHLRRFRRTKRRDHKVQYIESRKHYKTLIERKRETYNKNKIVFINKNKNDSSVFWKEIKKVCKSRPSTNTISANTWANHFKSLDNPSNLNEATICDEPILSHENESLESLEILNRAITQEEISKGIQHLKTGRAAGPDGIVGELLLRSSSVTSSFLTPFCNHLFDKAIFPFQWAKSILVPIFKKR